MNHAGGRKRRRRRGEVAWRGGRGCDEEFRSVAQKALVKEMVVGDDCGRKKQKPVEERGNALWLRWWFLSLDHDGAGGRSWSIGSCLWQM